MCTVCSSSLLGCLVDLNMRDDQRVQVQRLCGSVVLDIFQQTQQDLDTLNGPSTHSSSVLLGLGRSADTAVESGERNTLLVLCNIIQISDGLVDVHSLDGVGCFTCVLEVYTEVRATSRC